MDSTVSSATLFFALFNQSSPIDIFKQEFPDVLLFNGDVPANQRRRQCGGFRMTPAGRRSSWFNRPQARRISLHDTTGKHQRVLFNLGQPTQPTTAIQQEGRIYRTGQVTDAIFRYLNTGTTWEKIAFAHTDCQTSQRGWEPWHGRNVACAEDAFIAGFEESDNYRAGMEGEAREGKERDRAANDALTEYDRARSFYFGTQKKNAQTKAKEGKDYFAAFEPVGLKMAEFADVCAQASLCWSLLPVMVRLRAGFRRMQPNRHRTKYRAAHGWQWCLMARSLTLTLKVTTSSTSTMRL